MRDAGLDENEVAGFVFDRMFERRSEFVSHAALEDVEHDLEVDVDMRGGDTAGWDGGDVHGQLGRRHVLRRQAGPVLNPVPAADIPTTANHENSIAAFDRVLQLGVGTAHQAPLTSSSSAASTTSQSSAEL